MKPIPPADSTSESDSPRAPNDDATGLPWPTTWRGVYLLVIGCFFVWIALLALLTEVFS